MNKLALGSMAFLNLTQKEGLGFPGCVCVMEKVELGSGMQIQKIQGNFLLSGNGLGGLAPGSEQKLLSISVKEYHATREKNKNPRHRISSAVLTLNFLTVNEKGTTASRDIGLQKKTVEINQPIYIYCKDVLAE